LREQTSVGKTWFVTLIRSAEGVAAGRLLLESLRTFGGPLKNGPVWVFIGDPKVIGPAHRELGRAELVLLDREDAVGSYPFADKVRTCAQAEEMAARDVRSLVWLSLGCLIVGPPRLFELGSSYDAALRPVHIRNVGSRSSERPDAFWEGVYRAVGAEETCDQVESLVDSETIRPYFNTHCFSVNPSRGVLRSWWSRFEASVSNQEFQAGPCRDELHRIFLHQAVLSAVFTKLLDWNRIRILPDEYSYPLHLHPDVPATRRIAFLNDVICAAYEELQDLKILEAREPLKSWLAEHVPVDSSS
jgi:hypothetical protein